MMLGPCDCTVTEKFLLPADIIGIIEYGNPYSSVCGDAGASKPVLLDV